jgi:hypothetical protein
MKKTKPCVFAAAVAVLGLTAFSAAQAAPPFSQGPAAVGGSGGGSALSVDLRPYRHCHWSNGRRWCHGPHYEYDEDYGEQPFVLPFFLPFLWDDGPDYRYRRDYDRRDWGGREYRRRDYRGRDGRRDRPRRR